MRLDKIYHGKPIGKTSKNPIQRSTGERKPSKTGRTANISAPKPNK